MRSLLALIFLLCAGQSFAVADREIAAKHLKVVLRQSAEVASRGQRVDLIADLTLPPAMHVYAPGVAAPYRPIQLRFEADPKVRFSKTRYPKAQRLRLEAINEVVPAFQGSFVITKSIRIVARASVDEIVIRGHLDYQTCDDKICYLPVSVPIDWTIRLRPSAVQKPHSRSSGQ